MLETRPLLVLSDCAELSDSQRGIRVEVFGTTSKTSS